MSYCQLSQNEELPARQLQIRINLNYGPLSRLSIDLKVMPRSNKGHKYILCIIDEVTNYLITVPLHQSKLEVIGDALIENVNTKYCLLDYILMDQDSALMSSPMSYLLKKFDIKIKTVAPYNHQSLQAEHGIKSTSTIAMKHSVSLSEMWPKYLLLATFRHNTLNTPNLVNFSPYKLVLSRQLTLVLNLETMPHITVSGTFKDYYNL